MEGQRPKSRVTENVQVLGNVKTRWLLQRCSYSLSAFERYWQKAQKDTLSADGKCFSIFIYPLVKFYFFGLRK